MSVLHFWRKDFHVWLTLNGWQRLLRLARRTEGDEDEECPVIDKALALYAKAVDWESNPVFCLDSKGEYEPCRLGDHVLGPCGLYLYRREYCCSWGEWRVMQRLLAKSGDDHLSMMVERALELLEITLDGKLPELYTFDNSLRFERIELPLDTSFI